MRALPKPIRHFALIAALAAALCACNTDDTGGGGEADAGSAPDGVTAEVSSGGSSDASTAARNNAPIDLAPEKKAFVAKLENVIKEADSLTIEQIIGKYQPQDAAKPVGKLGYDPLKAQWMDVIDKKLALNKDETAKLAKNGFVVSERWTKQTMAHALLDVFKKDLPILVTTDMILQALHASYDDILKGLEREVLFGSVQSALAKAHGQLAKDAKNASGDAKKAIDHADFFVAVARSLLAGSAVNTNAGATLDDEVANFLGHIKGLQLKQVVIFGTKRKMDFSQFKPRGHYEGDPKLEKYFRCMMWLGRADLRFMEFDAQSGQWVYHPAQVATSIALFNATTNGKAMPQWHQANDLITLMVGPVDYIDFSGVEALAKDFKLTAPADVFAADNETEDAIKKTLLGGKYGTQQIASHWLTTNPLSSKPTPLAPSFAFLGQRFVVDSYVFSNVVYDRVVHNGVKVKRRMPDPLDAMFVLGNNHALMLLKDQLQKHPYQGALHTLRFLVDSYDPTFWEDNLYNLWLAALRTLNKPTTTKNHPTAMHSTAWADKSTRTQLASWAQLRHDTILYAKQSYTGGVACEHPDGFVEPYPEFYGALAKMADISGQSLANAPFENKYFKTQVAKFFDNWKMHMLALQAIAKKELKGEQLSADDISFLKKTIVIENMCGGPIFNGWYTSLYFRADNFDKFKPTIADVHTNPNTLPPLGPPGVLHVATSDVNLMVFTSDKCGSPEAFVGPVFRYHEVDPGEIQRYTDSEWETMLKDGKAPGQPAWTSSFMVTK